MTENNNSTMSFDRMRNMLTRAAEIRESEQQQIFDALDEIHARMSPLESLGSVRKRLSELPDRTEVSVLAERLDEALAKLEAQDTAVQGIGRMEERGRSSGRAQGRGDPPPDEPRFTGAGYDEPAAKRRQELDRAIEGGAEALGEHRHRLGLDTGHFPRHLLRR